MGDHWAKSDGVLLAFEGLCSSNNAANEHELEEMAN